MKTLKRIYTLFYLLVLFGFASCSANLSLKAQNDGSVKTDFTADMGAYLSQALEGISANMGGGKDIINAASLKKAFTGSDFTGVSANVPNKQTVIVSGTIVPLKQQKTFKGVKTSSFVKCEDNKLTLTLSPALLQGFYNSMGQEDRTYLDLFMAPIFTGEKMTQAEYKELVASVYGQELADDMQKGKIVITLTVPDGKSIKNSGAKIGRSSKASKNSKRLSFSIPMLEFLTLQTEKTAFISW